MKFRGRGNGITNSRVYTPDKKKIQRVFKVKTKNDFEIVKLLREIHPEDEVICELDAIQWLVYRKQKPLEDQNGL